MGPTLRIVSYNILNGGVGRADPIGEVLEAQHADVIVLVEADDGWVVDRIAKRLKMDVIVAPGGKHAVAVLSRLPIYSSINYAALDPNGPRSWVGVHLQSSDAAPFVVMAVHLTPRATNENEQKRLAELKRVLAVTEPLRQSNRPHVIVGDFNANAPQQRIDLGRCKSSTQKAYANNGNAIPRDAIQLLLQHGYVDTLAAARGDAAFDAVTFTTHEPGQRVDYVFTFSMQAADAWVEQDRLATYASDHYPIGAALVSPPGRPEGNQDGGRHLDAAVN
jgi:endonuclease/exonuclease/phosphatase family metal-dependent hydrolase